MKRTFIILAALFTLSACDGEPVDVYQGYAEGDYVLVASPEAGVLEELAVQRGEAVETGMPLFALERRNEAAGRQQAEAQLRLAQARLGNLDKGLRSPEIDALRAAAEQAEAARKLAEIQLKRDRELLAKKYIAPDRVDADETALASAQAQVDEAKARLKLATESLGRAGEIEAARAEVDAAQAALEQAEWRLAQKSRKAPEAGLVHDTFFVAGEWVPAGKPVVSLLPPANIKLRFYVPETVVGGLRVGQGVKVSCDGCGAVLDAAVSYVSPAAEFTPPVIYSRESRAKLVFMIEARPAAADAARLKPGQPVDVRL
ncbi:MAG: HlyD family efflux transporter periplasmic adaptor subunit [Gammaproteobacteria bacterium]|nr:HlyD family efflux transporter periplasmic adaptor subunit [Gammaproteobacteria bacterium]